MLSKKEEPKHNWLSGWKDEDYGLDEALKFADCESLTDSDDKSWTWRRVIVGLILMLVVVGTWVLLAECLQESEYISSHEIFMRYVMISTSSLCAIVALIMEHCFGHKNKNHQERRSLFLRTSGWTFITGWGAMFFAGYLWYLSLRETMVALNNSLFQAQCLFVYILSVLFLGERLTIRKILAVCIALAGVFFISFGKDYGNDDNEQARTTLRGLIFCIISSFLFSIYEVTVKYVEQNYHDEEFALRDSLYFLGYCGFWCLTIGPLMLFICHHLGLEHFDLPPDKESLLILIEVCIIDVVFNAAVVLAITVTTPYFVGLGFIFVIPTSFLADWFLQKLKGPVGWMQIFGIILIVFGFLELELKGCLKSKSGRVYHDIEDGDKNMTSVTSIKHRKDAFPNSRRSGMPRIEGSITTLKGEKLPLLKSNEAKSLDTLGGYKYGLCAA